MNTQEILNVVLLIFALFFILVSTAAVIILVQVLSSIKRILSKTEDFLDNIKNNQEEIKIKILDYTENVLLKIRNLLDNNCFIKKGGGNDAATKKEK